MPGLLPLQRLWINHGVSSLVLTDIAPIKCNLVLSGESFLLFIFSPLAFHQLGKDPRVAYINSHHSLSLCVSSFNALVPRREM